MKFYVHTPKAVRAGHPIDRLFVVTSKTVDKKGVTWFKAWKCTIMPNGLIRHPASTALMSPSALLRFKPVETKHCTPTAEFKHDSFYKPWEARLLALEVNERTATFPGIMPVVPPTTQDAYDAMSAKTQELVFKSKKAMTKAEVVKLRAGTWVVVKWLDTPDVVMLLTAKPDRTDSRPECIDLSNAGSPRPEFDQIIGTRGCVEVPALHTLPEAKWSGAAK